VSTHECPADGCTEQLDVARFACLKHWYELPPELRAKLSTTWRAGNLPEYLEVREEAVALLGGTA